MPSIMKRRFNSDSPEPEATKTKTDAAPTEAIQSKDDAALPEAIKSKDDAASTQATKPKGDAAQTETAKSHDNAQSEATFEHAANVLVVGDLRRRSRYPVGETISFEQAKAIANKNRTSSDTILKDSAKIFQYLTKELPIGQHWPSKRGLINLALNTPGRQFTHRIGGLSCRSTIRARLVRMMEEGNLTQLTGIPVLFLRYIDNKLQNINQTDSVRKLEAYLNGDALTSSVFKKRRTIGHDNDALATEDASRGANDEVKEATEKIQGMDRKTGEASEAVPKASEAVRKAPEAESVKKPEVIIIADEEPTQQPYTEYPILPESAPKIVPITEKGIRSGHLISLAHKHSMMEAEHRQRLAADTRMAFSELTTEMGFAVHYPAVHGKLRRLHETIASQEHEAAQQLQVRREG